MVQVADRPATSSLHLAALSHQRYDLRTQRRTFRKLHAPLLTLRSQITNVINYVELSFQNMNIVYTQNTFSEYSTIITNSWLNSTQNISSAIFDQPETLYGFINNGAFFLDGPPPASQFNVSEALTQAFFANILAEAWDGGAKYGSPFVL